MSSWGDLLQAPKQLLTLSGAQATVLPTVCLIPGVSCFLSPNSMLFLTLKPKQYLFGSQALTATHILFLSSAIL